MFNDPLFALLIIGWVVVLIFAGVYIYRSLVPRNVSSAPISSQVKNVAADENGYRIELKPPHDHQAPRNRFSRLVVFLAVVAVLAGVLIPFGMLWGSFFSGWMVDKVGLVGFLAALGIFYILERRLFIYVPEWKAYVTQDPFSGYNVPYGPGLHISYPWEQRNADGNEPLDVITKPFSVSVQTSTSQVQVEGSFQYAADLARITTFIGNDVTTIEGGFIAFFESFLSERYAGKDAENARTGIGDTNKALADRFMGTQDADTTSLEDKFGIIAVSLVITKLKLPDAVQKTRDAVDEAAQMQKVVAKTYGIEPEELAARVKDGRISLNDYNKMLNRAMSISENAEGEVKIFEGLEGVGAAGAIIAGMSNQQSNNPRRKRGEKGK